MALISRAMSLQAPPSQKHAALSMESEKQTAQVLSNIGIHESASANCMHSQRPQRYSLIPGKPLPLWHRDYLEGSGIRSAGTAGYENISISNSTIMRGKTHFSLWFMFFPRNISCIRRSNDEILLEPSDQSNYLLMRTS
jgi:hypothetical protein